MATIFEIFPDHAVVSTTDDSGARSSYTVSAAVTPTSGNNRLYHYNLPEALSLHPAAGLKKLFPGLQERSQSEIDTLHPAELVEHNRRDPGNDDQLVIKSPGEEHHILAALADAGLLKTFRCISLQAHDEPMYESSQAADITLAWLEHHGFELQNKNTEDSDWPTYELERHPLQGRIDVLQGELVQARKTKQALESDLSYAQDAQKSSEIQLQEYKETLQAKDAELQGLSTRLESLREEKAEQQKACQAAEHELAETKKAKQALEADLAHARKSQSGAEQQLAELREKHQESQEQLEKNRSWFQNRKKQAEQLETEKAELLQQIQQLKNQQQEQASQSQNLQADNQRLRNELEQLKQEKQQLLEAQTNGQQSLSQLEARMEQLFNQQAGQLQQAANALGKHVTQSFANQRQNFQAITGLNHYLETGEQPLEFGQWAIGADLASHLVRAVAQNSYDLIIEFGSGTSTLLMARAVLNTQAPEATQTSKTKLEYVADSGSYPVSEFSAQQDLPQRILSFEQDKTHEEKTRRSLAKEGLKNLVDLVLAPLVPARLSNQQSEQTALFYDCEQKLARIAQLYEGRQARILVLVDGPSSPQGNPLAREPALACLLQYLSAHQLHIVLDDSNRPGERRVAEQWRDVFQQRGINYQETELHTEKGALWLTVNP
tara:strand:+ start:11146 stop:13137 length:1992 start_codon:yes stop_codon:yes gene_type:complete